MYLPCHAGWGMLHTIAPSALLRVAYNHASGALTHQYARYKKFINQEKIPLAGLEPRILSLTVSCATS